MHLRWAKWLLPFLEFRSLQRFLILIQLNIVNSREVTRSKFSWFYLVPKIILISCPQLSFLSYDTLTVISRVIEPRGWPTKGPETTNPMARTVSKFRPRANAWMDGPWLTYFHIQFVKKKRKSLTSSWTHRYEKSRNYPEEKINSQTNKQTRLALKVFDTLQAAKTTTSTSQRNKRRQKRGKKKNNPNYWYALRIQGLQYEKHNTRFKILYETCENLVDASKYPARNDYSNLQRIVQRWMDWQALWQLVFFCQHASHVERKCLNFTTVIMTLNGEIKGVRTRLKDYHSEDSGLFYVWKGYKTSPLFISWFSENPAPGSILFRRIKMTKLSSFSVFEQKFKIRKVITEATNEVWSAYYCSQRFNITHYSNTVY